MPRTYVPVRDRAARALPADPTDVPPAPGGVVEFAQRLAAAGHFPEMTPAQRDLLEMFDGGRRPLRGVELAHLSRRAGRRAMRTLIAAHAMLNGETVTISHPDRAQAEREFAEALILVEALRVT